MDKKHLDHAYKILSKFALNKHEQRPHIWLSNVELGYSEWYYSIGDRKRAIDWTKKAQLRAIKYNLETRKLDAVNLLKKLTLVIIASFTYVGRLVFAWTR